MRVNLIKNNKTIATVEIPFIASDFQNDAHDMPKFIRYKNEIFASEFYFFRGAHSNYIAVIVYEVEGDEKRKAEAGDR